MRNTMSYRRRAATGLAAMSAGAALLVVGVAGPASAHGDQEPEPDAPHDATCLELAEHFQVDQDWSEYKITELPDGETKTDYLVDDRGTSDTGDDFVVTIQITSDGALLEWWSTVGIDAVYVNGTNAEKGSYFYLYAPKAEDDEATHDYHLGVPPWNQAHKNQIESVSFCYDESKDTSPTTAPETTVPPTTAPETTVPATTVPEETTTTVEDTTTTAPGPTTEAPTTAPPTTDTPDEGGGLPVTGSNTGLMVAIGVGLLAIGAALVASKRQIWKRFAS